MISGLHLLAQPEHRPSTFQQFPKYIHLIWVGKQVAQPPAKYSKSVQSWVKLHPTWTVVFWNNDAIHALMDTHFPGYKARVYDKYPLAIEKADIARVLVLVQYGGVYTDLDFLITQPIESAISAHTEATLMIAKSNVTQMGFFSNCFFVSTPQNPVLTQLLTLFDRNINQPSQDQKEAFDSPIISRMFHHILVIQLTGPRALDYIIQELTLKDASILKQVERVDLARLTGQAEVDKLYQESSWANPGVIIENCGLLIVILVFIVILLIVLCVVITNKYKNVQCNKKLLSCASPLSELSQ